MPVEGDDLGLDANFFHEFPGERGHCLADFDAPAGQAEMAEQRRPRSAHEEHPALSKHRRRNREDRARGKQPVIQASSRSPRPSISSGNRSQSSSVPPWSLTRREGSASRIQSLKSRFCNI